MTLGEIIERRGHKYDEQIRFKTSSDFWQGYYTGWKWAYQDIKEILEHNGFNMNTVVIAPNTYESIPIESN